MLNKLTISKLFLAQMMFLLIVLLMFGGKSFAQATGEINGTVRETERNEPLPGAQIILVGTTRGAATDLNGNYSIKNLPPGEYTIQVRFVGYRQEIQKITVAEGQVVTRFFTLVPTALQLDEIVVTGTGTATEKRTLGNTISTIQTRDLGLAPITSLTEVLQGRVAGVVALPSSGQLGAGTSLRIRGMTSINESNEPLVYIDGVRVDNSNAEYGSFSGLGITTGGQKPSRINDVAPTDIERIEIIKGASATTLYGTEGSAGVIQIFTKKGTAGDPRYNIQVQQGAVSLPKLSYGGPKGDSLVNSLRKTGPFSSYLGSIKGGGQTVTYYVSGRYENEIGALPANQQRTISLRANLAAVPSEKFDIQVNTGYNNIFLRAPNNDNNIFGFWGNALLANPTAATPAFPNGEPFTALSTVAKLVTTQQTHRFTGSLQANYKPIQMLRNKFTFGLDLTGEENQAFFPYRAGFNLYPDGRKTNARRTNTRFTLEDIVTLTNDITNSITSTFNGGINGVVDSDYRTIAQAEAFPAPGVSTVTAGASNKVAAENRVQAINAGFFFQEQIGIMDKLFLTGGLRVDGNSSFGKDYGLQAYPKASIAYVISQEKFWTPDFWNNLKLRAAFGSAGKAPGPLDALRFYDPIAALNGTPGVTPGNIGAPKLKPERSDELEFGFDAGFLKDRLGVEFTYYTQKTKNLHILRQFPPSAGFLNLQLDNIGEVQNKGVEIVVRAIPISSENLDVRLNATFATNDNKVTSLGGTAPVRFGLGGIGKIDVGYPVSSLWSRYVTGVDPATGRAIISAATDQKFLGQTVPKRSGSFSGNITLFKNLQLFASADWATGHVIYNDTKGFMIIFGVYQPAVDPATGANRNPLPPELDTRAAANFVEKADWLKIREIAASYLLPREWFSGYGIRSVTLSFAIRNVKTFTKYSGADPEVNYFGPAEISRGQDFLTVPPVRRFIGTLNVEF